LKALLLVKVDCLNIDCDYPCELSVFKDLTTLLHAQQLSLSVHGYTGKQKKLTTRMFKHFPNEGGYAIVQKEPNIGVRLSDDVDFTFFKLRPSFRNLITTAVAMADLVGAQEYHRSST
jgi:hypothetical protein